MRITGVTTRRVAIPLRQAYAIAGAEFDAADLLFVELATDAGARGFGQAAPAPEVTGETIEDCARELDPDRLAWLVGRDVADFGGSLAELDARVSGPAARAAIDMALHDLAARRRGLPLADLLGRAHEELPTSVTIGIAPVAETLALAAEHVARGFTALKVKIGRDVDLDLERLARLRERFGRAVALRADANGGYDAGALRRFAARAGALELELLEQPLPRGAEAELAALPAWARRILAADESLLGERDAEALCRPDGPFPILSIKLMKCGGIAAAMRIARAVERGDRALMWSCMDESALGIAAALHAAFASRATRFLDLDGSFDLARDPFRGGFELEGGRMRTLARPGLGVEPA